MLHEFLSCFTKYSYRLFIVERLDKYLVSFYKLRLRHWLVILIFGVT